VLTAERIRVVSDRPRPAGSERARPGPTSVGAAREVADAAAVARVAAVRAQDVVALARIGALVERSNELLSTIRAAATRLNPDLALSPSPHDQPVIGRAPSAGLGPTAADELQLSAPESGHGGSDLDVSFTRDQGGSSPRRHIGAPTLGMPVFAWGVGNGGRLELPHVLPDRPPRELCRIAAAALGPLLATSLRVSEFRDSAATRERRLVVQDATLGGSWTVRSPLDALDPREWVLMALAAIAGPPPLQATGLEYLAEQGALLAGLVAGPGDGDLFVGDEGRGPALRSLLSCVPASSLLDVRTDTGRYRALWAAGIGVACCLSPSAAIDDVDRWLTALVRAGAEPTREVTA
jgi:hypothetical protein